MDGTLRDPEWQKALPISDFTQYDPRNGASPTEKTEVRVLYTKSMVYFGVFCYDDRPKKILATQLIEYASQGNDDQFLVLVDPTHSGENGYFFAVNPLGTRQGALVGEEGALVDTNWRGIWYAEASIGKDGWSAEIAIPFSTLNFDKTNAMWKINFQRDIRRKQEVDLWTASERIYGIYKLSKAGEIGPFQGVHASKLSLLRPYFAASLERNPPEPFGLFGAAGLDYTYGLTSNLNTHLTVNPDFSEIPPDLQQVNLSPLPLFLPETRSFFLEREDIFDVGIPGTNQLFFSRNIGIDPTTGAIIPVKAGLKGDGSVGNEDVGVLAVQEGGDGFPTTNIEMERVKNLMPSGSYVGFTGIEQQEQNSSNPFNNTYAADYNLNFFNSAVNLQGFFAKTDSPGLSGNDWGAFSTVTYSTDWFIGSLFYEEQRPNFNPELGLRQFSNDIANGANFTFILRPDADSIREIHFYINPIHVALTTGQPLLGLFQYGVELYFDSGATLNLFLDNPTYWNLISSFQPFTGLTFQPGQYFTNDHNITYSSDPTRPFYFTAEYGLGYYYTGPYHITSLSLNWKPNIHLLATVSRSEINDDLPQGNFRILQQSGSLTYAFSRDLNLQLQLQNINVATPPTTLSGRLDYRFRPGSHFYLIYNLGPQFISSITGVGETERQEKLEAKYTYAFF